MTNKLTALIIMDGFGLSDNKQANAVEMANTPNYDRLKASYPFTTIKASGLDVGLPHGQMGNSEVGHLNIGAGRIVYQDLTRINKSIEEKEFFGIDILQAAMEKAKNQNQKVHFIGLVSEGGVHS